MEDHFLSISTPGVRPACDGCGESFGHLVSVFGSFGMTELNAAGILLSGSEKLSIPLRLSLCKPCLDRISGGKLSILGEFSLTTEGKGKNDGTFCTRSN
jgi:hypothetical protein